ncbi:DUF2279 domain-containing protein [Rufibacter latericius]|uniref:DUF2279 domain-containing protein n=1 Tax=Rufibacter latericius TaxID=2487040 RepID=A0A3M9MYW6_9BACT|nr:DUF2279 domain-containing protein [Rufibacter latericius]
MLVCTLGFSSLETQAQATNPQETQAAPDTLNPFSRRLPLLAAGVATVYVGGLALLNQAWYQEKEQTRFHWFDDSREWKQIDKAGHLWGAFHESRLGVDLLRKAGVPEKKAIWYGGALGFVLQTPIEYFDGRSPDYGASLSDIAANAAGSLAVITQQLAWGENRIIPKYSFHRTSYASMRPNVLGKGFSEEFLKDYNGHTYWFSVDLAKFLPSQSKFPKWLNPAVGFGAEEMVYNDADANRAIGLKAYRQYYLSVDLNWQAIPTHSKFLKSTFYVLSIFKFPAPALEYNRRKGWKAHALYF